MKRVWRIVLSVILIIYALSFVYPIFWVFINSFKNSNDIVAGDSFGLPKSFSLDGYKRALGTYKIMHYFTNSLWITAVTIAFTIMISVMLAYALARMEWGFKGAVMQYIMFGLLLPSQIVLVPIFIIIRTMGLIDNPLALILTTSAFKLSMSVIIAYGFLRSVPREMEEAAVIDGCNMFQLFTRIMLPILKPALATIGLNVFLYAWNEFMFALVLLSTETFKTLPIALLSFSGTYSTDWAGLFSAMVIVSIIPIVFYLFLNKNIEEAMSAGAILK